MAKQIKLSRVLWIFGSFSMLVILSFFTYTKIRRDGADIAGKIILELIKNESNNYYDINYEKIEISIYESKLHINNLQMQPDSLVVLSLKDSLPVNSFSVLIPEVDIRFKSFLEIILKKELNILSLRIVDPAITMLRTNEPTKRRPFSLEAGDLYLLISQYLKLFKIENFNIESGAFLFDRTPSIEDTTNFNIKNLHFKLDNFIIDEKRGNGKKVFFSESIELVINDQVIYLSDSIHQFSFKRLTISTEDEFIKFDDIKVQPTSRYQNDVLAISDENFYDFEIPTLHLKGVNFYKAYSENTLKIDSIGIRNPKILLSNKGNEKTIKRQNSKSSIGTVLVDYFDNVAIRQLTLKNGLVDLEFQAGAKSQNIRLENANINLGNFRVDSLVFDKMGSYKYFDDIAIDFKKYNFLLPDSTHQIYLDNFHLSTIEGIISADSVVLSPRADDTTNGASNLYNAYLPKLLLRGFDWHTLATDKQIAIKSVLLPNPSIKFQFNAQKQSSSTTDYEKIAAEIFPYLKVLQIDSFNIQEGKLHFSDAQEELLGLEKVNLLLQSFKLDENTIKDNDRLLFSDGVKLQFEDFSVETPNKSHQIELQKFMFDSRKNRVELDNFSLKPIHVESQPHPVSVAGSAEKIVMNGLMLPKFRDERHFVLQNISLTNPKFDIVRNHLADTFPSTMVNNPKMKMINFLSIGKVDLVNGSLRYADEQSPTVDVGDFTVSFTDFSLDSAMLQQNKVNHQLANFQATINQITYWIKENNHSMRIGNVELDQNKSIISIKNIGLSPLSGRKIDNSISLTLPEVQFYGVDIESLLIKQDLIASTVILKKPDATLKTNGSESKNVKKVLLKEVYERLSAKVDKVKLDNILLEQGNFEITTPDGTIFLSQADAWVDYFALGKAFSFNPDYPFFAQNYLIALKSVHTQWTGKPNVAFKNASVNYKNGQISLNSVQYKKSISEDEWLSVLLPHVTVSGLNFERWYNDGALVGNDLVLTQPHLEIATPTKSATKTLPPEKIELPIPLISFDNIELKKGKFERIHGIGSEKKSRIFSGLYSKLEKFYYDSTVSFRDQLFYAEKAHLAGESLAFATADSLFDFNIGKYELFTNPSQIVLSGMQVVPRYNRFEHSAMVGYQTDWISGTVGTITLSKLDLESLLYENKLFTQSVIVDSLWVQLFRDKKWQEADKPIQKMPQMALLSLDIPIEIDTVGIKSSFLQYEELAEESRTSGKIYFQKLNAYFYNVVNTQRRLSANDVMTGIVHGQLMGAGDVKLTLYAPLQSQMGAFKLSGSMGSMHLDPLNEMLGPVAFVKIKSGVAENLKFEMEANEDYARGDMKFYYKNLKISLLSKKGQEHMGMGHAIGSFFANTFIIRSNNPSIFLLRNGDIYFERDDTKSIFNYWSKSILSGIISSVGAKSNKHEIKRKNKEAIQINKDRIREEKYLEDKIGIYE